MKTKWGYFQFIQQKCNKKNLAISRYKNSILQLKTSNTSLYEIKAKFGWTLPSKNLKVNHSVELIIRRISRSNQKLYK